MKVVTHGFVKSHQHTCAFKEGRKEGEGKEGEKGGRQGRKFEENRMKEI